MDYNEISTRQGYMNNGSYINQREMSNGNRGLSETNIYNPDGSRMYDRCVDHGNFITETKVITTPDGRRIINKSIRPDFDERGSHRHNHHRHHDDKFKHHNGFGPEGGFYANRPHHQPPMVREMHYGGQFQSMGYADPVPGVGHNRPSEFSKTVRDVNGAVNVGRNIIGLFQMFAPAQSNAAPWVNPDDSSQRFIPPKSNAAPWVNPDNGSQW